MVATLFDGETPAIRSMALHEAGHYVVARVLGFQTGEIVLRFNHREDRRGTVETELFQYEESFDGQAHLEKRIQVLLAGVMAESLIDGTVDEDQAKEKAASEGAQDRYIASEYISMVRRYRQPTLRDRDRILEVQNDIFKELWVKALEMVEKHQDAIVIVGEYLAGKVKQAGKTYPIANEEVEALPALEEFFQGLAS